MPLKPPAPHFQVAARRRACGESLRPLQKHTFDGQTLFKLLPSDKRSHDSIRELQCGIRTTGEVKVP